MARRENFKVSITPKEALDLVKENENADLVHEEIHNFNINRTCRIGTIDANLPVGNSKQGK